MTAPTPEPGGPDEERRLVVELNAKASTYLAARVAVEELNKTTIVNRALQVYGHLAEHEDKGGQIILIGADGKTDGLEIL